MSQQLPSKSKVADFGTLFGQSAASLAYNPEVAVWTFDIEDQLRKDGLTCKDLPNVHFIQGDCKSLSYLKKLSDCVIIFLDINPHDGSQEQVVLGGLQLVGFRGLLICDDIFLSKSMMNWWESLQLYKNLKTYDVTKYGHWSGTGIVVFDEKFIDINFG